MKKTTQRFTWATILIAPTFLSVGCTANKKPSQVETALANMAKDVVIPIEAENVKNPVPANQQALKRGQQVYLESCALCHGTDGHGEASLGRAMYPPAMDLTSPHVQHWSDAELFWIIQNGVRLTGMPSWKSRVSETDTWNLVRFIHTLPELNAREAARATVAEKQAKGTKSQQDLIQYGRTLYRQEGCFICHQLSGEGGKVGPDLTVEGVRGRTEDWLIGHFKNPSAYTPGSIMPAFKNLTEEQLKALTVFPQARKGS
jgi:mono/diheme cytochrome c family protein